MEPQVTIHEGDCLKVMATLPANSMDAFVVDPPYHLTAGKASKRGVAGKIWDAGEIAHNPETWRAVSRLLKPGGHLVALSATKNYDLLVGAIRAADFQIRDMLAWVYASGFPKSNRCDLLVDKEMGMPNRGKNTYMLGKLTKRPDQKRIRVKEYKPRTPEGEVWQGFGTSLKPAIEPICLARKPLSEATIAKNLMRWGTGALNIDATRSNGKFTANIALQDCAEVNTLGMGAFFFIAKATAEDKMGIEYGHPTVKPHSLMCWLVDLVSPPGRGEVVVGDCFAGTGTTGVAALRAGKSALLIEKEPEYVDMCHARVKRWRGEDVGFFA